MEALRGGLLIVDDEKSVRFTLSEALREDGHTVFTAADGGECFEILQKESVDLVILDQNLKETGEDGLDILSRVREKHPDVTVIMLTAFARFDAALEAGRRGCYQYIKKPPDLDQLRLTIQSALHAAGWRRQAERLKEEQRQAFGTGAILGRSQKLQDLLEKVRKAARSATSTVLLWGETGVGKELLARTLHDHSPVSAGPFVDLNCSAIPEQLLESTLFGHEKGAFTDARAQQKGLFELANGGTLFLDEIVEMSLPLQAKLLRVLETKTFRRVGGTADIQVRTRIVAATNKDLHKEVDAGRFREDLYYRLTVIPIHVPPLRERREDVPALADYFVAHFGRELGRPVTGISPEAMAILQSYPWPGNVRELRNLIERIVLMESGEVIRPEHLPPAILEQAEAAPRRTVEEKLKGPGRAPTLADAERVAIEAAMEAAGGNKTRAAEILGISRQTLRTKLKEYGMQEVPAD
jgi:DNA-binding NtrC family response regulator